MTRTLTVLPLPPVDQVGYQGTCHQKDAAPPMEQLQRRGQAVLHRRGRRERECTRPLSVSLSVVAVVVDIVVPLGKPWFLMLSLTTFMCRRFCPTGGDQDHSLQQRGRQVLPARGARQGEVGGACFFVFPPGCLWNRVPVD